MKIRYLQTYDRFMSWQKKQYTTSFPLNVILPYFNQFFGTLASTTLRSEFSMIKGVIKVKRNVNIDIYPKLISFLNRTAAGYSSKKAKLCTFSVAFVEKNNLLDYIRKRTFIFRSSYSVWLRHSLKKPSCSKLHTSYKNKLASTTS